MIILKLYHRVLVPPKQLPEQGNCTEGFAIAFPAIVRAEICHLFRRPVIAHPLFVKETMGIFNVHQLMSVDGTPSVTSISGTAHTLMINPICEIPG